LLRKKNCSRFLIIILLIININILTYDNTALGSEDNDDNNDDNKNDDRDDEDDDDDRKDKNDKKEDDDPFILPLPFP
jgi:hypothetical protein